MKVILLAYLLVFVLQCKSQADVHTLQWTAEGLANYSASNPLVVEVSDIIQIQCSETLLDIYILNHIEQYNACACGISPFSCEQDAQQAIIPCISSKAFHITNPLVPLIGVLRLTPVTTYYLAGFPAGTFSGDCNSTGLRAAFTVAEVSQATTSPQNGNRNSTGPSTNLTSQKAVPTELILTPHTSNIFLVTWRPVDETNRTLYEVTVSPPPLHGPHVITHTTSLILPLDTNTQYNITVTASQYDNSSSFAATFTIGNCISLQTPQFSSLQYFTNTTGSFIAEVNCEFDNTSPSYVLYCGQDGKWNPNTSIAACPTQMPSFTATQESTVNTYFEQSGSSTQRISLSVDIFVIMIVGVIIGSLLVFFSFGFLSGMKCLQYSTKRKQASEEKMKKQPSHNSLYDVTDSYNKTTATSVSQNIAYAQTGNNLSQNVAYGATSSNSSENVAYAETGNNCSLNVSYSKTRNNYSQNIAYAETCNNLSQNVAYDETSDYI